ncbi:MAG: ABC transporter ATP-binding protein [Pseudomonadota bacterium]
MSDTAIELRDLRFGYRREQTVLAIDEWNVPAGSSMFLRGPSGSGKSTLLHLICGILSPDAGSIAVCGQAIASLRGHARDRFRARHIGVVFQQFNLLPYLTVADNLRLAARFGRSNNPLDAKELLERLRLPVDVLQRQAGDLSVGQQQRVAIARALINRPELLIADEPTSALDTAARNAFVELLLEQAGQGAVTVLFVSHDSTLATHFDSTADLTALNTAAVTYVD